MALADAPIARRRLAIRLAVVGLVLIGWTLRVYRLDSLPPGLHHDEAIEGLNGLDILAGNLRFWFPAGGGREPLFMYLAAGTIAVLGPTALALRVIAAAAATAVVPGVYVLGRRLFDERVGLVGAALVATSYWQVHTGRLGLRSALLAPLAAVGLALLFRALDRRPRPASDRTADASAAGRVGGRGAALVSVGGGAASSAGGGGDSRAGSRRRPRIGGGGVLSAIGGGAALGLTVYTYFAARLLPAVVLPVVALELARARRDGLGAALRVAGLYLGSAALVAAPMAIYTLANPTRANERVNEASVFSQADPLGALRESVLGVLGMFFLRGDEMWKYNLAARPLFGPVLAVAFVVGLLLCLARLGRRGPSTALLWLVVMSLPSALATESPHFIRIAGLAPILDLIPALALVAAWDGLGRLAMRAGRRLDRSSPRLRLPHQAGAGAIPFSLREGRAEGLSPRPRGADVAWAKGGAAVGSGPAHRTASNGAAASGLLAAWAAVLARARQGRPALSTGLAALALVSLVGWTAIATGQAYFRVWGSAPETGPAFASDMAEAAALLRELGRQDSVYLSVDPYEPRQLVVAYLAAPVLPAGALRWFDGRRGLVLPPAPAVVLFPASAPPPPGLIAASGSATLLARRPLVEAYRITPAPSASAPLATFGPAIELLRVEPRPAERVGATLPLLLVWRVVGPIADDLTVFVQIENDLGGWGSRDDRFYLTTSRQPGETIVAAYDVPLDPGTPGGRYRGRLGVYRRDGTRLRLADGRDHLVLAPIDLPPPRLAGGDDAIPGVGLAAEVAPGLRLRGAAIEPARVKPGESLTVRTFWTRASGAVDACALRLELTAAGASAALATAALAPAADVSGGATTAEPSLAASVSGGRATAGPSLAASAPDGRATAALAPSAGAPAGAAVTQAAPVAAPVGVLYQERQRLMVAATAPPGRAELRLIACGGAPIGLGSVEIEAIERRRDAPSPPHPLAARFGDAIRLLGYDLTGDFVPGGSVQLTLYWAADGATTRPLTVFAHVLDPRETVRGQRDSAPMGGARPTTGWQAGEFLVDRYEMTIDRAAPPGAYAIEIGLYDPTSGVRQSVSAADGQPLGDRLIVVRRPLPAGAVSSDGRAGG